MKEKQIADFGYEGSTSEGSDDEDYDSSDNEHSNLGASRNDRLYEYRRKDDRLSEVWTCFLCFRLSFRRVCGLVSVICSTLLCIVSCRKLRPISGRDRRETPWLSVGLALPVLLCIALS